MFLDRSSSQCQDEQYQHLLDMQVSFAEKSAVYHDAETKWRSRAFQIAVTLGILPVLAGVVQLMPRDLSPWITLFISILNVIVVVTNVKLDIGERIADASMAGKSFGKLATQIDLFFCQLRCSPQQSNPAEILTVIRTVLDTIDTNLNYPEMPKCGSQSKVVPFSVPGGLGSLVRGSSFRPSSFCASRIKYNSDTENSEVGGEVEHPVDCEEARKEIQLVGPPNGSMSELVLASGSATAVEMMPATSGLICDNSASTGEAPPLLPPAPPNSPPPASLLYKVLDEELIESVAQHHAGRGGA